MKCHIIQDLLPLFAEQLTSPETDAAIRAHLESCEACAQQYAETLTQSNAAITAPEDITPLKSVKKRGKRNTLLTAAAAAVAAVLLAFQFYLFCLRGFQLRSEQIEMHISTYWDLYDENAATKLKRFFTYEEAEEAVSSGACGKLYEQVSVVLDGKCLSMRTEQAAAWLTEETETPTLYQPRVTDVSLYAVKLPPIGSPVIRHKSLWSRTSLNSTAAEGASILIRCSDGCFAYDLRTLAALADASPDGTAHLTVGEKPVLPSEQTE